MASSTIKKEVIPDRTLGNVKTSMSGHTSVANKFVAPKDGILIHNSWESDSYATVTFLKSDDSTATSIQFPPTAMNAMFIPKGTKLYATYTGANLSVLYGAYNEY